MDTKFIRKTKMWEVIFPVTVYIEKVDDIETEHRYMQATTKKEAIKKAVDIAGFDYFCSFDPNDVISIEKFNAKLLEYVNEPTTCSPLDGERYLSKI